MTDQHLLAVQRRRARDAMGGLERRSLFNGAGLEARTHGDAPEVFGYATTFMDPYDMLSNREQVARTAFDRCLSEQPDCTFNVDHGRRHLLPLARTRSAKGGPGTLTLRTDSHGLAFTARLDPEDPDAQALMRAIKSGLLWQCSMAFRCLEDSWDDETNTRTLKVLSLHGGDVSCVSAPANENTSISARAMPSLPRPSVMDLSRRDRERVALMRVGVHLTPPRTAMPSPEDRSDYYRRRMAEIRSRAR
jgi:HK97 family phage prohead protease